MLKSLDRVVECLCSGFEGVYDNISRYKDPDLLKWNGYERGDSLMGIVVGKLRWVERRDFFMFGRNLQFG